MPRTPQQHRPFSLRLSADLTARIDECAERLRRSGLPVSRTDVARMLITRALDALQCDTATLLGAEGSLRQGS